VDRRITRTDIARALRADGLATVIAGSQLVPDTCFAENVGLVRPDQVISRYVVAAAGVIMLLIGLCPRRARWSPGIPHPVLGGAALAMISPPSRGRRADLSRVGFHDHR